MQTRVNRPRGLGSVDKFRRCGMIAMDDSRLAPLGRKLGTFLPVGAAPGKVRLRRHLPFVDPLKPPLSGPALGSIRKGPFGMRIGPSGPSFVRPRIVARTPSLEDSRACLLWLMG